MTVDAFFVMRSFFNTGMTRLLLKNAVSILARGGLLVAVGHPSMAALDVGLVLALGSGALDGFSSKTVKQGATLKPYVPVFSATRSGVRPAVLLGGDEAIDFVWGDSQQLGGTRSRPTCVRSH